MIEVLEHGNTCRCTICNCLFKYEKEDVRTEDGGRNDYYNYVKCPECGKEIRVIFK